MVPLYNLYSMVTLRWESFKVSTLGFKTLALPIELQAPNIIYFSHKKREADSFSSLNLVEFILKLYILGYNKIFSYHLQQQGGEH